MSRKYSINTLEKTSDEIISSLKFINLNNNEIIMMISCERVALQLKSLSIRRFMYTILLYFFILWAQDRKREKVNVYNTVILLFCGLWHKIEKEKRFMFTILLLFFFGLKTQDREREGLCIQYHYFFSSMGYRHKIEKERRLMFTILLSLYFLLALNTR